MVVAKQLALLLVLALCMASAQARRIALVIGNDSYVHTDKLANARNDAVAMTAALQRAGFTVTQKLDAGREALFQAVDSFVLGVRKEDEVVVFFSGHGVQIDAAPYLLPIDIKADTGRQVTRDALSLDALVGDLGKARYALVIVDACRNNPFAARGLRSLGAERGLAPIEPPEGTAIIMSAGRGQTALDSLGATDKEKNGLFTREFLRVMETPGLQVRDLLLQVRDSVEQKAASVNHKQRPALVDESRGQFYFRAPAPQPPPPVIASIDPGAVELAFWNSVQRDATAEDLRAYLQRYPGGQFADLARLRLARLTNPLTPETTAVRSAASQGDAAAMARLGFHYADGTGGLPRDELQAEDWLRRAAELDNAQVEPGLRQRAMAGNPLAMALLGVLHSPGLGVGAANEAATSRNWYQKAAEGGNGLGMNGLGMLAATGRDGPKDEALALAWYRKGADAGHPLAMTNLGFLYEQGRAGLPKDEVQALAWYRKAVVLDTRHGMHRLGVMYELGRGGLAKDDAQAVAWWRKGAERGDPASMAALGFMVENGRGGLSKDDTQAVGWYRKAAQGRNARAMFRVGLMYLNGRGGLPKDEVQAVAWWQKSADAGDNLAVANLGVMYKDARGGLPRDDERALAFFRKAANNGDMVGMNGMGLMYRDGRGGVPKDVERAKQWFQRAADLGFDAARTNLARLP